MEPLANDLLESLRTGHAAPEVLETAGASEPHRDAAELLSAAADPDLAHSIGAWAPALLLTARPGFGARSLAELARRRRAAGAPLEGERASLAARVLGNSNFLARLLLRHPDLADDLVDPPPPPSSDPVPADRKAIRASKYRGLLRIAARDLWGRPFDEGLTELSDLADRCLRAELASSALETTTPAPALFALGKLGGRELNLSSDVDLLFVYDAPPNADPRDHHEAVSRLVKLFRGRLEEPDEEGFTFRVDLDLRPGGRSGPLAHSVEAALTYYESRGAEWERQMLIRLRRVAGAAGPAEAFSTGVAPFVYRRLIDPGVLDAVRGMKQRIEDERRLHGRDLEASLKEGPGGIRDVEFLVQSLQLFYGARHPELRTGNVLDALDSLGQLQLLPARTAASLRDGYLWLRRAEHALQLVEEQQTHRFPRAVPDQIGLARRMGYADARGSDARERLLDDWVNVRSEVRGHFDALVLREAT